MSTEHDDSARESGDLGRALEVLRAERDSALAERDDALAARDKASETRDALLRDVLPLAYGTSRKEPSSRRWGSMVAVALLLVGLGFLVRHMALAMQALSSGRPSSGRRSIVHHTRHGAPFQLKVRPKPRVRHSRHEAPVVVHPSRIAEIPMDHLRGLQSAALDARGRWVAAAGRQGRIQVYDLLLNHTLRVIEAHRGATRAVRFVDADRMVSGGADGHVVLWNVRLGRRQRVLRGAGAPVRDLAVAGGLLAVACEAGAIELYDLRADKAAKRLLTGHQGWVRALAVDAQGKRLASAGHDRAIRIWELPGGKLLRTLPGHAQWVAALAFDPSGRLLASAGFDNRTHIWELGSGALLQSLRGHVRQVTALAFDARGQRVATASLDRTVILWDARQGRLLRRLSGHRYGVSSVAFAPRDAFLLSASSDATLRLWGSRVSVSELFRRLPPPGPGELTLRGNTSGERLRVRVVSGAGKVLASGRAKLAVFLRSGPDDSQHLPDAKLVQRLYRVANHFGRQREIVVISGYRSPLFNRLRTRQSKQVSKESRHLRGQAIDFRISGIPITTLHRYLKKQRWGGLGLYPDSNFVHMDVGPVRLWQGD